jgi:phosphoglucomutase
VLKPAGRLRGTGGGAAFGWPTMIGATEPAEEISTVSLQLGADLRLDAMTIEVIDPVADYTQLMERLFDFDAISELFASGTPMSLLLP